MTDILQKAKLSMNIPDTLAEFKFQIKFPNIAFGIKSLSKAHLNPNLGKQLKLMLGINSKR